MSRGEEMELYYQNETLYIDINQGLTAKNYQRVKERIFKIITDYEVEKIVVQNSDSPRTNRHLLNQMRHEYRNKYNGDFLIK